MRRNVNKSSPGLSGGLSFLFNSDASRNTTACIEAGMLDVDGAMNGLLTLSACMDMPIGVDRTHLGVAQYIMLSGNKIWHVVDILSVPQLRDIIVHTD